MNSNINRWRVELPDNDSDSDSDYENFDNSLFSSFSVRQNANTDHSRIPTQSSFSSPNMTFRAYFPPWRKVRTIFRNPQGRIDRTAMQQSALAGT